METETFLWRRKADLDLSLRTLDKFGMFNHYILQIVCFCTSKTMLIGCFETVEQQLDGTFTLKDAAHTSGLSEKELTLRASITRSGLARTTSSVSPTRSVRPKSATVGHNHKRSMSSTRQSSTKSGTEQRSGLSKSGTLVGTKGTSMSMQQNALAHYKGVNTNAAHLQAFLRGATAAQKAQVEMIKQVFDRMDADNDGLLSMSDVRVYFRSMGRNASDPVVRRWIQLRDVDQDGAVSLSEFVASFALQLDPSSKYFDRSNLLVDKKNTHEVSAVTSAFGAMRLGCTTYEAIAACDAIEHYVQRILDSPSVKTFWVIPLLGEFEQKVGHLFGGIKLMHAMGFRYEANGTVLAVGDQHGKEWELVPVEVRTRLQANLEELRSHRAALSEPTISNIAAGRLNYCYALPTLLNSNGENHNPFTYYFLHLYITQCHQRFQRWARTT